MKNPHFDAVALAQAGISLAARNALALPGDGASVGLDRQRCGLPDGCFHLSDIRVTDRYSDRPEACDSGRQFYLSLGLPHVARHKPGAHWMYDRTGVRPGRGSRSPHRSLESPGKQGGAAARENAEDGGSPPGEHATGRGSQAE